MRGNRYSTISIEEQVRKSILGNYPKPPDIPKNPKFITYEKINPFQIIHRDIYFLLIITGFFFWMYIENDFFLFNIITIISILYLLGCVLPIVFKNKKIKSYNKNLKDKHIIEIKEYDIARSKYKSDHNDYQKRAELNKEIISIKIQEAIYQREKIKEKLQILMSEKNLNKEQIDIYKNYTLNHNIENIETETYSVTNLENQILDTIHFYSGICSIIAIQPIPFADIFILTPTQIIMGSKIAKIRGYDISDSSIRDILKEITGIIGMGLIAQQLLIGAYKTILPFWGGITTIPAVYGLTYGIGKVMDYYIITKINSETIDKSKVKELFKSSQKTGKKEGKIRESEIISKSKNEK